MGLRNFPGVYTTIIDQSQFTTLTSRFRGGLVGVAEKGPFDRPLQVTSIADFQSKFGKSIPGHYLANCVQLVANLSDGLNVVRVGRQYESVAVDNASGSAGSNIVYTPNANLVEPGDYIRITQLGLPSTVNARVDSVATGSITLVSGTGAITLAANYTAASVDRSSGSYIYSKTELINAANEAEAFLDAPTWGPVLTACGDVLGNKNEFSFEITGDQTLLNVGDIIMITQGGAATTREVRIRRIIPPSNGANAKIFLEQINRPDIGYQSIPLQDSYVLGRIQVKSGNLVNAQMLAVEAGTWANSDGVKTGMIVTVGPGTAPDTKKILVWLNSANVETFDNLSDDPASANYYETAINGKSSYIAIRILIPSTHLGNTVQPYSGTTYNVAAFSGGFNGETATTQDFIGTINPDTGSPTGLKIFEDTDYNLSVDVMACPGVTDISVAQEMGRICHNINARYVFDIPDCLNGRQAIDWHNGAGVYSGQGKIDDYTCQFIYNWFEITDTFTGNVVKVPPTCGAMRCLAYTFDADSPWAAAAGERRGLIPEARSVEYPNIPDEIKQQFMGMPGNTNAVNPIILNRGQIMLFGDRTAQRRDSKLTAAHSVTLVNRITNTLASLGRKYIFEAIDDILISQMNSEFKSYLDTVKNGRGLEAYNLVMDSSNNNATTRNQRTVIVDLYIIPIDVMEKLYLNVTVRESGATLNFVR